jgi:hypothetical protein
MKTSATISTTNNSADTTTSTTNNSVDPADLTTTTISNPTDPVDDNPALAIDDSTTHANDRQLGEPENVVEGIHKYQLNRELLNQETQSTPLSTVPESPTENNPEVSSPIVPPYTSDLNNLVDYVLSFRHNRGKPPNRYSPDIEERRSKFLIANYVSTQHPSDLIQNFTKTLSFFHIPDNIEDAFADPK